MKSIRYSLVPSKLPRLKDEDKFVARVHIHGSLGFSELADRIVAQGSTVTKPDILAVFENLATALDSAMLEGCRVNFGGVFGMYPTVRGTFPGPESPYDPSVNSLDVRALCGPRIRDHVRAVGVPERIIAPTPAPLIQSFHDLSSATRNVTITPGNIGTVCGERLKFNPDAEDEGIFLIPLAGGDTIQITVVQRNKPKELIFLVPTLTPGAQYWVEVRTRLPNCETLRPGRLFESLAVSPLP